jgi:hypothetical protein
MRRKLFGLPIPVLFVIGCLVSSSSAYAQKSQTPPPTAGIDGEKFGPHFNFVSALDGGASCLTVKNGELLMVFPCNTSRESRVEVMDGFHPGGDAQSVLRIKTSLEVPQVFLSLTVTLPDPLRLPLRQPIKVMANPTGLPFTPWRITAPDDKGLRSVLAVFEAQGVRFCMMPRLRPDGITDVVVNDCGEGPRWKLNPVPAPT